MNTNDPTDRKDNTQTIVTFIATIHVDPEQFIPENRELMVDTARELGRDDWVEAIESVASPA